MTCCQNCFEEIEILNTRFHKVTVYELIQYIVSSAKEDQRTVIGHVNVHAMNYIAKIPWYSNFFRSANLVFCDGFGVLLAARLNGYSIQSRHRMTCPDYIEDMAKSCERDSLSLFLLAGKPGIAEKAIEKLKLVAPTLRVDGHHGYFRKDGQENLAVIQKINLFKPHILYVGFGMPLQEKWIAENISDIDARVFLPLGACLDFYTDSLYRGPKWMTDSGLEWLARLFTEPSRLWDRYIIGNPLFFYRVLKNLLLNKAFGRR